MNNSRLFTDRVKTVLQLAREEAIRLMFDYVGSEHLMLGIIRDGNGVAVEALKEMGVDLDKLVAEIEKGCAINATGISNELLPFTPRAKKIMEMAQHEARIMSHHYVGTEHLLLALLKDSESPVANIFSSLNITYELVKDAVTKALQGKGSSEGPVETISAEMKALSDILSILVKLPHEASFRVLEYCRQYITSNIAP